MMRYLHQRANHQLSLAGIAGALRLRRSLGFLDRLYSCFRLKRSQPWRALYVFKKAVESIVSIDRPGLR